MPVEPATRVVLGYLSTVDALMREEAFDARDWHRQLLGYLDDALTREAEAPTEFSRALILHILRKSLGSIDA